MLCALSEGRQAYGVMLLQLPSACRSKSGRWKLLECRTPHGATFGRSQRRAARHRAAGRALVIARELHIPSAVAHLPQDTGDAPEAASERKRAREQAWRFVEELKLESTTPTANCGSCSPPSVCASTGAACPRPAGDHPRFLAARRHRGRLHDRLLGHELDSSEQIHVLQVVREALTNVEHHAHAAARRAPGRSSRAASACGGGRRVGIKDAEPPTHHYGLAIMRDRAATLAARCKSRRAEGGTRVN